MGVKEIYGRVCHQRPDRVFTIAGDAWLVCHRCAAIYLSFLCATALMPFVRARARFRWSALSPRMTGLLLLPLVIDGLCDLLGVHDASLISRLVTGSLAGAGLAFVVVPLFIDAIEGLFHRHRTTITDNDHVRETA